MNWQAVNFDWNQVRAFLATVEEGSLSGAARALGLTQPTLGRQVTALEEQLGVTLFERSGRALLLTPTGQELVDHVRAMGEAATRLSLAASGQSRSVEGRVRISASEMYSAFVLPEFVEEVRKAHPGIVIEIVATNALSDLRQREADIAVRNTAPTDSDMIARRLPDGTAGLYGTPDFVSRYGPFDNLTDLGGVPMISIGDERRFIQAMQDRKVSVTEANFVAGSSNHLVHWALVQRGLGLGVNGHMVGKYDPSVVPVLRDQLVFDVPFWLVAPSELKTSRRIRIVFDLLVDFLGRHSPAGS